MPKMSITGQKVTYFIKFGKIMHFCRINPQFSVYFSLVIVKFMTYVTEDTTGDITGDITSDITRVLLI